MSKAKGGHGGKPPRNTHKDKKPKNKAPPAAKNLKRKQHPTSTGPSPKKAKPSKQQAPQVVKPTIPFNAQDRILLVGEGDFSYAASLTTSHACRNLVATSFDSSDTLATKYPQCATYLEAITAAPSNSVYHGIDATTLHKSLPRAARTRKYDRVVFNFPHTGGLSTDVNRQVRHNQELLVKFLKGAKGLLSREAPGSQSQRQKPAEEEEDEQAYNSDDADEEEDTEDATTEETPTAKLAKEQATILVTLFESEPYTLWNIKDLARHVGLKSITSFVFPWESYPGYRHARTIGTIEGKGGAWKGEDRVARTYVFGLKKEEEAPSGATGANAEGLKRKRGRGRESESESDGE